MSKLRTDIAERLFNVAVNITNSGIWVYHKGLHIHPKRGFYYKQADYIIEDIIEEIKGMDVSERAIETIITKFQDIKEKER